MTFQILKNDKIVFQTDYEECIPPEDQLKEMEKSGYKVKRLKGNKK